MCVHRQQSALACVCMSVGSVRQQMCILEQAAESSAAPRSLRTSCSFLLGAMKSNQSAAVSPGLTSAFNYRTQQREEAGEGLPPLGRGPDAGLGAALLP